MYDEDIGPDNHRDYSRTPNSLIALETSVGSPMSAGTDFVESLGSHQRRYSVQWEKTCCWRTCGL